MKRLLLFFAIAAIFISCDDVFDKKIERNTVEIIAPHNGATLTSGNILFSWKAMDGALRYQLVIASPAFDYALRIAADTTIVVIDSSFVSTYNYPVNLAEGNYQWYVEAQNFSYSSKKQIYDLIVVD